MILLVWLSGTKIKTNRICSFNKPHRNLPVSIVNLSLNSGFRDNNLTKEISSLHYMNVKSLYLKMNDFCSCFQ